MAKSEVKITAKGVDKTRGMFRTIRGNIAKVGASAKRIALGVAAVGTGIAAGFTAGLLAVRSVSRELSTLSDRAAQVGESSSNLSRLSTAFGVLGVKGADLETITKGLQKMTQTTGRVGVSGLKQTLAEIASIGDEQGRIQKLSDTFGKAFGPGMAALVRQGPEALLEGFDEVLAAMPAVSDSLTDRADRLADAFELAGENIKTGWQAAWMEIAKSVSASLGMTEREFGATFGTNLKFWLQVAGRSFGAFVGNVYKMFSNFKQFWKIVFVDWLWGYVEEGVSKAWVKMKEWFNDMLAGFVYVYEAALALFTDDTVEAAGDRYFQKLVDSSNRANAEWKRITTEYAGNTYAEMRRRLQDEMGMTLEVDISDLVEERDRALAAVSRLEDGIAKTAQGVAPAIEEGLDAEETGRRIGKAISAEMKNATWLEAGSNALAKTSRQRAQALATFSPPSPRLAVEPSRAVAKESKERQSILAQLKELLTVQRDGWRGVNKAFAGIGVV